MDHLINRKLLLLLAIALCQCVDPVYYNKKVVTADKPAVYFIPSRCFGKFYFLEISADEKFADEKCLSLEKWEFFDEDVDRAARNAFRKHDVVLDFLEKIDPALQIMIEEDSTKKLPMQYHSLKNICKEDFPAEIDNMKPGVLIMCTELEMIRMFPDMRIVAKYYVYKLPEGDLILANYLKKRYVMTGIAEGVLSETFESYSAGSKEWLKAMKERQYGLWEDEKEAYAEICNQLWDEIAVCIVKKCKLIR